jgi:ATP-binding cassette subfamily B (MDR/TAP) protein 1
MGEKLTRKLRVLSFEAVLRQPMAFFDSPRNAVGRLNTRLGTDAALVRGGTGESLGQVLQGAAAAVSTLSGGGGFGSGHGGGRKPRHLH